MRIKAKTFRAWMRANFTKGQLRDMTEHGVDTGWHGLTYYSDTCKLYERFKDEIWAKLAEDAESMGEPTPVHMLATFKGIEHVQDATNFENLLVWYMAETVAREIMDTE